MAIDQRLVWGGIAVGGAGIAIYMYRKNKKQQAQATQAQQSAYAYGYGGYAYGYGQQQTYSPYGYGFGPFGLGAYGGTGDYGYGYYGAGGPAPVPQQATTNAQWSEAAVSALTSAGYDAQSVLAALGLYLTGGNLSSDQAGIINAAIAAEGYPPQSGPGGYPPAIHQSGTAGGGTGGGQGSGGGGVTGGGGGGARAAGMVSGLNGSSTRTTITARWSPAANATGGYAWIVRDLSTHSEIANGHSTSTNATVRGLKSGTDYNFGVQGLPGGPGANIHIRTK